VYSLLSDWGRSVVIKAADVESFKVSFLDIELSLMPSIYAMTLIDVAY